MLDAPIRFVPQVVAKPWGGGARLRQLGLDVPTSPPTGEVWLLSDVPGRPSVVSDGPWTGRTLSDLVREQPLTVLGRALPSGPGRPRFPLLVKLLEIGRSLSVQVHPDAATARAHGDGPCGKFEAWAVLDAAPGARVVFGVDREVTRDEVRALVGAGRLEECLNFFVPAAGDACVISPGVVHSATDGVVLLEVQETSDVTYRLYDWGAVGLDGRPRDLHVEKALACAVLTPFSPRRPPAPAPVVLVPGVAVRSIVLPGGGPFRFDLLDLEAGARAPAGGDDLPWTYVAVSGRVRLEGAGWPPQLLVPGRATLWPASLPSGFLVAEERSSVGRAIPG